MKKIRILTLLILSSIFTCCDLFNKPDDPDIPLIDKAISDIKDINFSCGKDAKLVVLNTKLDWNITASNDWILLTENKGKGKTGIIVGVENNLFLPRKGKITISTSDTTQVIEIKQAGYHEINYTVKGINFKLILAPAGKFMMGTTGNNNSSPLRQVKVDSFYVCETEVTNELWKAVTGTLPYDTVKAATGLTLSKLNTEPVSYISWNDVQKFLTSINLTTGQQFRLPTEAEWQYAATGANKSKGYVNAGSNNLDEVAWFRDNAGMVKHPVKLLYPNELGLYDMSGNVSEWCNDWYKEYYGEWYSSSPTNFITVENPTGPTTGTYRVTRGGNFMTSPFWGFSECDVNARSSIVPVCYEVIWPGTVNQTIVYRCESVGFRFILPVIK